MSLRYGPRFLAILIAIGLAFPCLAGLALSSSLTSSWPMAVPLHVGGAEIALELDRSPTCPNQLLGMCDRGGTGPTYLSVWLYAWPAPNMRTARPVFAVQLTP